MTALDDDVFANSTECTECAEPTVCPDARCAVHTTLPPEQRHRAYAAAKARGICPWCHVTDGLHKFDCTALGGAT